MPKKNKNKNKNKNVSIEELVAKATKEFLNIEDGKKVLEETCGNFNYANFGMYVPNSICSKYGFLKLEEYNNEIVLVDLNTSLL